MSIAVKRFRPLIRGYHLYLFIDWLTSGLAFLFMLFVYRFSEDGSMLANNAWLLNLLTTSLFVSMASQYFTLIRGIAPLQAYVSFAPIIVIEISVISFLLPSNETLVLASIVLCNLLTQSFRGQLIGEGKLIHAALNNLSEQALRFGFLFSFLFIADWNVSLSLLTSNLIACALMFLYVLSIQLKRSDKLPSLADYSEAMKFGAFYFGIYLLSTIDILSTKAYPAIHDSIALMKPWGLIIYTLSGPFINVYLSRRKNGLPTTSLILQAGVLYVCYIAITFGFSDLLNLLIYNKALPSHHHTSLIVLEHILIASIVALFHHYLNERRNVWILTGILYSTCLLIYLSPLIAEGKSLYWAYIALLSVSLLAALSIYPLRTKLVQS